MENMTKKEREILEAIVPKKDPQVAASERRMRRRQVLADRMRSSLSSPIKVRFWF